MVERDRDLGRERFVHLVISPNRIGDGQPHLIEPGSPVGDRQQPVPIDRRGEDGAHRREDVIEQEIDVEIALLPPERTQDRRPADARLLHEERLAMPPELVEIMLELAARIIDGEAPVDCLVAQRCLHDRLIYLLLVGHRSRFLRVPADLRREW